MFNATDAIDNSCLQQEIEYQALYNALYWTNSFGLFFVQCTPAQSKQLIARLIADMLHHKQIVLLHYLNQQPEIFIQEIQRASDAGDILFISGIEKSLDEYMKEGFGGQGYSYKENSVPKILAFLNLAREKLKREFSHVSFVFLLPIFGIKYCIHRAKDFFDWHSGVFRFSSQHSCYQLPPKPSQTIRPKNTLKLDNLPFLIKQAHISNLSVLVALPFAYIGECFSFWGKNEAALLLYQKVSYLNPKYAMFWHNYGKVLFNLGCYESATVKFNKALAINPTYETSWCYQGNILIQQQHYEQAIASFDKALKIKPNLIKAWLGRGEALRQLKSYSEARQAFEQALAISPKSRAVQHKYHLMDKYLKDIYETLDDFKQPLSEILEKSSNTQKKTLAKLAELSQNHPHYSEVLQAYARALSYLECYEEAAEYYAKAVELDPNDESAWFNHGQMMDFLKRYEKAVSSYGITTDINPENQEAWSHKGYAFEQLDRSLDAIMSYNQLIEINPNAKDIWQRRDVLLKKLGEHEIRKANYRKALKIYGKNSWLWCKQGELLDELGENEEAINCFTKTVHLKPDDEWAWYKYGHSLEKLGQYEEAIAKYDITIQLNPTRNEVWHQKIASLEKLGYYEEALKTCYQAMQANPDGMQYNDLFKESERYEELLRISKQKTHDSIDDDPRSGYAWHEYELGQRFVQLNDHEKSIDCFNKAIELEPSETIFLHGHCQVLEKLSRYDEVLLDCDKILRIHLEKFTVMLHDKVTFKQIAEVINKVAKYRRYNPVLFMNVEEGKPWEKLGFLLRQAQQLELAAQSFEQGLYFFPNNLSLLANDLELALLQQDKKRLTTRFKTAKLLLEPNHEAYVLVPFLAWLAQPNSDWQIVKKAIPKLKKQTRFSWQAHDDLKQQVLEKLNPSQQRIAYALIKHFQKIY